MTAEEPGQPTDWIIACQHEVAAAARVLHLQARVGSDAAFKDALTLYNRCYRNLVTAQLRNSFELEPEPTASGRRRPHDEQW